MYDYVLALKSRLVIEFSTVEMEKNSIIKL